MHKLSSQLRFLFYITGCVLVISCINSNSKVTNAIANGDFIKKILKTKNHPGSVESADFNKDGFPDIVSANPNDSSLSIFLNDGKANFTEATGSPFFSNRYPNDVAITDVNNDGNSDLCVANTEASFLSVFEGNGKGQFQQVKNSPFPVHSKPHTHGIAAADFNGDGNVDLATDDWGENKIVVVFGDGKGHFSNQAFFNVGNRPYQRLRSADVNKDGKPDLISGAFWYETALITSHGSALRLALSPYCAGSRAVGNLMSGSTPLC